MHLRNAFLILSIFAASALDAEIKVSTRFEPPRIAAGNTSKYIVEIVESDGSSMPSPERITSLPIPQSGGLTLRNGSISTGQQTRITNGVREFSSTQQLIIDAAVSEAGSYTIPAYIFEYKGGRLQAPAATLTVVERSVDAAPSVDELIFLKADAPQKLYVGQTTPITLKLYVSDNVQLRGLNAFERSADGFTVSRLPDESIDSTEMVNGRRYRVLNWPMKITPISAGLQDLNFQFTLTAQMPNQRNTRNAPGRSSPFGGSLFDDFFGRSERFNIYTEATQIEVRALPAEGRPESFSGAIGDFNMEVYADADVTRVDEPIMLSLKLSGRGNFDRIKGPEMPTNTGWRNYSPEAFFESNDSLALKGVKRFDYVFVPEKSGALKLPEVSFAFFDPKAEKYVELTSPALSVQVAPSNRPSVAPQPQAPATDISAPALNLAQTLTPEKHLLTLDYRPSAGRTIKSNRLFSSWFYGLNTAALLTLIASAIWISKRKRLQQDADAALIHQAKHDLKAALKTSQSSDAEIFYRSAQEAIRLASTKRIKRNLRSADLSELEEHFKQIGLPEEVIQNTRTLFQDADNHRFSGIISSTDLTSARTRLNTILKAL